MFFFLFDDSSKTPDYSNVSEAILSAIKKLMDGVMDIRYEKMIRVFSLEKKLGT